ncbi:MAG: phosphoribosylformylglycinamidine cyclo-ligase [Bdellovibrio sp.]|nr:phosphoribosylformylglycinamidine cyclo-ligase [Bdellovibrio sp.]
MIDYKKSGVDIQTGDELVSWLQNSDSPSTTASTLKNIPSDVPDFKKRVVSGIGGFAALFDGRFQTMKKPLLVSCTDGVGTKVKVAAYFKDYSTVGQDLVGMCVNDLICTGGTPLFFLDYYAVGKLDLNAAQSFLTSIKKACEKSHLVLIGGETAEMPGVYQESDFDCAGFSVGVVDEEKMWGAHKVSAGDKVLGIESSGFHSNGYSLLRKVFENEFDQYKEWLMKPTQLYVEAAMSVKAFDIHAAAHITGGGVENIPRVLPAHLKVRLTQWELPECFKEVQKRSGLSLEELRITFNCGIGFVLILPQAELKNVESKINELGLKTYHLGVVEDRSPAEIQQEIHVVWD